MIAVECSAACLLKSMNLVEVGGFRSYKIIYGRGQLNFLRFLNCGEGHGKRFLSSNRSSSEADPCRKHGNTEFTQMLISDRDSRPVEFFLRTTGGLQCLSPG